MVRTISNGERGSSVRPKINRLIERQVDVRDYGADTAAEDNIAAFEAARDAAGLGTLFVPAGTWNLSRSLDLGPNSPSIIGQGRASELVFAAGGIKKTDGEGAGPVIVQGIEKLHIRTQSTDWAIEINDTTGAFFLRDILTYGLNGIYMGKEINDWTATNISCRYSTSLGSGQVGFVAGTLGSLRGYNCHAMAKGLIIDGTGVSVTHARIEECGIGVQFATGYKGYAIGCRLSNFTIEACGIGVDILSAGWSEVSNGQILCYQVETSNPGQIGVLVGSMSNTSIERLRIIGNYAKSGFSSGMASSTGNFVKSVTVGNTNPDGLTWDIRGALPEIDGCDIDDFTADKVSRSGSATITAGDTEELIAFPVEAGSGAVAIASVTDIAGSLDAGTYEYALAAIDFSGPFGDLDRWDKSVAVTSGGARVSISSPATGLTRRLYRREEGGEYWGYFDLEEGQQTFDDTGQAFDGYGGVPRAGATRPTYCGADTGYRVTLTPEFEATVWVKERRTDGILIGLSAGHPGGTLRWTLEN